MPPKTEAQKKRMVVSAAMKKYKDFSAIQLSRELKRLQTLEKKQTQPANVIRIAVVKKLISKIPDKEISATEARQALRKKVPAKKQVTKKEFEKARKDLKDKKVSKPALSRGSYIKEYEKYSLKELVKEKAKLDNISSKKMPIKEILARQDAINEVIGKIPESEFDKLDPPKKKKEPEKKKEPLVPIKRKGLKPPPDVGGLKWKIIKQTNNDKENSWEWEATGEWIDEPGETTTYNYFQDTMATEDKYWDGEELKKGSIRDENGLTYTVPEFKRKYNKLKTFKMTTRERNDLIFQWELWWRKNGGLGLKDYMIMPTRVANNAFKSRDEIEDKNKREKIFRKLQELIDDGNYYDGTTWKTITAKDVKDAVSS